MSQSKSTPKDVFTAAIERNNAQYQEKVKAEAEAKKQQAEAQARLRKNPFDVKAHAQKRQAEEKVKAVGGTPVNEDFQNYKRARTVNKNTAEYGMEYGRKNLGKKLSPEMDQLMKSFLFSELGGWQSGELKTLTGEVVTGSGRRYRNSEEVINRFLKLSKSAEGLQEISATIDAFRAKRDTQTRNRQMDRERAQAARVSQAVELDPHGAVQAFMGEDGYEQIAQGNEPITTANIMARAYTEGAQNIARPVSRALGGDAMRKVADDPKANAILRFAARAGTFVTDQVGGLAALPVDIAGDLLVGASEDATADQQSGALINTAVKGAALIGTAAGVGAGGNMIRAGQVARGATKIGAEVASPVGDLGLIRPTAPRVPDAPRVPETPAPMDFATANDARLAELEARRANRNRGIDPVRAEIEDELDAVMPAQTPASLPLAQAPQKVTKLWNNRTLYRGENTTGAVRGESLGKGVYLTEYKPLADSYAKDGKSSEYKLKGNVRILESDSPEYDELYRLAWDRNEQSLNPERLAELAKDRGYKGIAQVDGNGDAVQIVIFDRAELDAVIPARTPATFEPREMEGYDAGTAPNLRDGLEEMPRFAPDPFAKPAPKSMGRGTTRDLLRERGVKGETVADGAGSAINIAKDMIRRLDSGDTTAQELKAFAAKYRDPNFIQALKSDLRKLKKDDLARMTTSYARSDNSKEQIIDTVVGDLETALLPGDEMLSWGMSTGSKEAAIDRQMARWTDDMVKARGERTKAEAARQSAERADFERAVENPESLEDFKKAEWARGVRAIKANPDLRKSIKTESALRDKIRELGRATFTPEQAESYDRMSAYARKSDAEQQAGQKLNVPGLDKTVVDKMVLVETKHTKKGHDLFVVKMPERVDKDVYTMLNERAKKLGGYYSSYRGQGAEPGFQFKTKQAAEEFMSGNRIDGEQRLAAKAETQKQGRASALRSVAESTRAKAEESLNKDRLANTTRRAGMAASAEDAARADLALADTMERIADAIESNQATMLDKVRSRLDVQSLYNLARMTQREALRGALKYDELEDAMRVLKPEHMAQAEYPWPTVWESNFREAFDTIKGKPGLKRLAASAEKIFKAHFSGDGFARITRHDHAEVVSEFFAEAAKHQKYLNTSGTERYKRISALGWKTGADLRTGLREYVQHAVPPASADPIKELERGLIGVDIPGFFPTPRSLAQTLVEKADVQPGMLVLEPSAGKGDLVEAVKSLEPNANVVAGELSGSLHPILKAKGIDVAFDDFLTHTPGEVYDRIVMNPPFEKGMDIEHVRHAYELLKPGGKVVAIMSEGPFYRADKQSVEFRQWLDDVGGISEKNPDKSFEGADAFRQTGVATRTVELVKPQSAPAPPTPKPTKDKQVELTTIPEKAVSPPITKWGVGAEGVTAKDLFSIKRAKASMKTFSSQPQADAQAFLDNVAGIINAEATKINAALPSMNERAQREALSIYYDVLKPQLTRNIAQAFRPLKATSKDVAQSRHESIKKFIETFANEQRARIDKIIQNESSQDAAPTQKPTRSKQSGMTTLPVGDPRAVAEGVAESAAKVRRFTQESLGSPLSDIDPVSGKTIREGIFEKLGGDTGRNLSIETRNTQNRMQTVHAMLSEEWTKIDNLLEKYKKESGRDHISVHEDFVDTIELPKTSANRFFKDPILQEALELHDVLTEKARRYTISMRRKRGVDTPDDWGLTNRGYFRHSFSDIFDEGRMDSLRMIRPGFEKKLGFEKARQGGSDYVKDYSVMAAYIDELVRQEELTNLSKQVEKAVAEWEASGSKANRNLVIYANEWLNDLWGKPTPFEESIGNAIFGGNPYGFKKFNRAVLSTMHTLKLKWNIRGTAVNLLQPLTTLWQHGSSVEVAEAVRDALRKENLQMMRSRGVLHEANKLDSDFEIVQGKGKRLAEKGLFGLASEHNRAVGYMFGYNRAKAAGMAENAAHKAGLEWANITEFDNTQFNRARAFRDEKWKLLTQYKGFMFKNLEMWGAAVKDARDNGNYKRLAKLVGTQGALGGVKSFPFLAAFIYLDAKEEGTPEQMAKDAAFYGALAALGADISSSVDMLNTGFGNSTEEKIASFFAGPTVGTIARTKTAIDRARKTKNPETRTRNLWSAARAVTPYAGQVQAAVDPNLRDKKKTKATARERMLMMLGFNPVRQSRSYDREDRK